MSGKEQSIWPSLDERRGKKLRIGIFGGSFNPIHVGHIGLARYFRKAMGLDEVWLMVTPLNPFKTSASDLLPDQQRFLLARQALAREPHVLASNFEFRLAKPSYTWQTLQALHDELPESSLTLIIGADNWLAFDRWRNYQDILRDYPLTVYPREGYPVDPSTLPSGVTLVDTPLFRVSSTMIRPFWVLSL